MSKDERESLSFGLNQRYWDQLSDKDRALHRLIRPMPPSSYSVSIHLGYLERCLAEFDKDMKSMGGSFEMCPDFQRGHVWDRQKQIAFVEALLRGNAPTLIRFNCPNWQGGSMPTDIGNNNLVCVDGLQRVTALLAFLRGEIKILGNSVTANDLKGTSFDPSRPGLCLQFQVYSFCYRKDLLQFYIDLNTGGVVHTDEEIARVKALITKEAK